MVRDVEPADDVYEAPERARLPGEGSSDVIRGLPGVETRRSRLSDIAGRETIGREGWREVLEAFRRQGELDDLRREALLEMVRGEVEGEEEIAEEK